ncbi:MAG TPA: hypothetical protein VJR92_09850 [Gemmatimonadaceae bacterium]|nr:hypothetical protein [Gemmatimonadaceae bacterium]
MARATVALKVGGALLLVTGGLFVLTGLMFALTPATLEPWGFRAEPGFVRRVLGLAFFGAVGAILIHNGRGLIANTASSRSFFYSLLIGGATLLALNLAGF